MNFKALNGDMLDYLDQTFSIPVSLVLERLLCRHGTSIRSTVKGRGAFCGLFLITLKIYFMPFLFSNLSPAELQAAVRIHCDTAPTSKHGKGFLEAGSGLSLHIHSDAERRRSGAGKLDPIHVYEHEQMQHPNT